MYYLTEYFVNLAPLTEIQSLSWKGLNRFEDFASIRDCIKKNGKGIKSLTLDLIDWVQAEDTWFYTCEITATNGSPSNPDNFFAQKTLRIRRGQEVDLLPNLTFLSLSAVSFQSAAKEMTHALHVSGLRVLKLRNCPHYYRFLEAIIKFGITPSLKSFELVDQMSRTFSKRQVRQKVKVLGRFLKVLERLEDLFLMLDLLTSWKPIGQGISKHRSTLKRLITDCFQYRQMSQDYTNYIGPIWNRGAAYPFRSLPHLRCIGISGSRPVKREQTGSFDFESSVMATKPSCIILHIRVPRLGVEITDWPVGLDISFFSANNVSTIERFNTWARLMKETDLSGDDHAHIPENSPPGSVRLGYSKLDQSEA